MCTKDRTHPCEDATCPGFPGAICTSKVCSLTYRGQLLPPCTAIWSDPFSGDIVNCDAKPKDTIT